MSKGKRSNFAKGNSMTIYITLIRHINPQLKITTLKMLQQIQGIRHLTKI